LKKLNINPESSGQTSWVAELKGKSGCLSVGSQRYRSIAAEPADSQLGGTSHMMYGVPNDPAPPIRPYMMASLRDMRRWSTSDRVIGKRNKAISSLTTVDTAVSRAIAFRNLLLLIGSGIERPAERSTSDIESKTVYQHSTEEDIIPIGRAIKLGIVRPA
jgi:hypothetical protein